VNSRRIVITGFMGSGKSSVAGALAQRLNCTFVDLDDEITRSYGRSPGQIIKEDGEEPFRKIESEVLLRVLETGVRVIALGGGAWTIAGNRELIAEFDCFTVWLDVPFDVCWSRIAAAGVHRPLAAERHRAGRLYEERRPLYSLAELGLKADDRARSDELAIKIESAMDRWEETR
jgi:shikimate kinase